MDSPNNVSEEAELKQSVQNPNLLVFGHDVFGGFIVEEFDGAAPEGDAGHPGLRERVTESGREREREGVARHKSKAHFHKRVCARRPVNTRSRQDAVHVVVFSNNITSKKNTMRSYTSATQ